MNEKLIVKRASKFTSLKFCKNGSMTFFSWFHLKCELTIAETLYGDTLSATIICSIWLIFIALSTVFPSFILFTKIFFGAKISSGCYVYLQFEQSSIGNDVSFPLRRRNEWNAIKSSVNQFNSIILTFFGQLWWLMDWSHSELILRPKLSTKRCI